MKRIIFKVCFCLQIIFLANRLSAQDIILLKNGDEIKSKVIEVTPDLIKYKKWENQDGPMYSSNKSEVFMIKYKNGTKDVFKIQESQKPNEVSILSENVNKKLNQEDAETTIGMFVASNKGKMSSHYAFSKINKIDPLSQFSENEASSIVHFNFQDNYTDEPLAVKFIFKRNIDKQWFLTSLDRIAGVGSQNLADDLAKFQNINVSVSNSKIETSRINNSDNIVKSASIIKNDKSVNSNTPSSLSNRSISVKLSDITINSVYYKTVTIGNQTWMTDNLKTTKYNDGSDIPEFDGKKSDWGKLITAAVCWYKNDLKNRNVYGVLYNWYAVGSGKLCPIGWHVPTVAEWDTLTIYLGGYNIAGSKLKEGGSAHWDKPDELTLKQYGLSFEGSNNESSFTALPAGTRLNDGTFYHLGISCYFWTITEKDATTAFARELGFLDGSISNPKIGYKKEQGMSVRCLKDN